MLGWIDYSKTERDKVLGVLDLLSERGVLDELGIAPIRDGFSNLFFPGTSTIQTRAKYFFIIPYAFMDLERGDLSDPARMLRELNKTERECCDIFLTNNESENGVIGKNSRDKKNWVKRTPADIYWSGLRQYGIFSGGRLTISEYLRVFCGLKKKKNVHASLGNRNDEADEFETDDIHAGSLFRKDFWLMPLYKPDWKEHLQMNLSKREAAFLKDQIVSECPSSLMAFMLKNNRADVLQFASFKELHDLIQAVPQEIQDEYMLALGFSDYVYVLRILFNVIVSDKKNQAATKAWENWSPHMKEIASFDRDSVFQMLNLQSDIPAIRALYNFIRDTQNAMYQGEVNELQRLIIKREELLKGVNRAKTAHPGEFDIEEWFCGGELDYRFHNAKRIISDIFEGEGLC